MTHQFGFKWDVLSVGGDLLDRTFEDQRLIRGRDLPPVQHSAAHLFSGIASHVQPGIVGFHDHFSFYISRNNPDNIGVDEGAHAFLALAQGVLGALLLLNIGTGAKPPDDLTGVIAHRHATD